MKTFIIKMRKVQNNPKQANKIQIVKNKEIIIYQNGEEFKRFKQSETKDLKENEMYILDFLINKYSLYEIPRRSSKLEENDFDFESTDEFFKKGNSRKNETSFTQKIENSNNFNDEEENRKTEPKLREFFKDVEQEENGGEEYEKTGKEKIIEEKKLRKNIKTTQDIKVPIQNKNRNMNYQYEQENLDVNEENEEMEEFEEEPPQYIIEAESYTSPTIKNIDEKIAENEILNGIRASLMINGQEKKGLLFLGKNEEIIFISFEDKKEKVVQLNNIKRIYFNIKGSSNLMNYKKRVNNDRFIQFVELNNKKTDFKFNSNVELEYFIKGLIQTFRNKSTPFDKNLIYQKNNKYFTYSSNKKEINNRNNKYSYNYNKINKEKERPFERKNITRTSYYKKRNENEYQEVKPNYQKNNYFNKNKNYQYIEFSENDEKYPNENYENEENYRNEENYVIEVDENNEIEENNENEDNNEDNYNENNEGDDDNFITTTITEVFKDGKLINEETKEEYGGVVTSLNSYSPDIGEYEEYLRKSTLRKSHASEDDINRSLDRLKSTNKFKRNDK